MVGFEWVCLDWVFVGNYWLEIVCFVVLLIFVWFCLFFGDSFIIV